MVVVEGAENSPNLPSIEKIGRDLRFAQDEFRSVGSFLMIASERFQQAR